MLNKGTKVTWSNGFGNWEGTVTSSVPNPNGADSIKVVPEGKPASQYLWINQDKLSVKYDPHCDCAECAKQR